MSTDPGLSKQPAPPPGQTEYGNMVSAVGAQKADQWKAEQTQTMFEAGAKPETIMGYWGDQPAPQDPIGDHVRNNIQRYAETADGSKLASSPMDAIAAGWDHSVVGLLQHQGKQPTVLPAKAGFVNTVLAGTSQFIGDAPYMVGGLVAGGAAGAAVPGAGETGASEVIGAGFGAGALPQGMREVLLDAHKYHPGMTAKDVAVMAGKSTIETLKEGTTNALSMLVGGKAGGIAIKAGLKPLISGGVNVTAQAATGATVHAAMEGQIPDAKDFGAAAVMGLGLHVAHTTVSGHGSTYEAPPGASAGTVDPHTGDLVLSTEGQKYVKNVQEAFRQTGAMPHDVAAAVENDPVIKQEMTTQDHNGNPNLAKTLALSANSPEPYQPRFKPPTTKADLLGGTKLPAEATGVVAPTITVGARDLVPHLEASPDISGKAQVSPKGAIGVHQIMPGTARQYMGPNFDVSTLADPKVNKVVYDRVMDDLERRFPGDPEAQLVAYNAGPGRVGDYLKSGPGSRFTAVQDKRYAGGWRYDSEQTDRSERGLPLETQQYLARARAMGLMKGRPEALPETPEPVEGHDGNPDYGSLSAIEEQKLRIAEARNQNLSHDELIAELDRMAANERAPEPGFTGEEGAGASVGAANTWEKATPEELDEEILGNIGEQPSPNKLSLDEVKQRWFSELTPARNLDTRLMKAGLYDRDTEFGFEDAGRATYGANGRAAHFWNNGTLDPRTLEKASDNSAMAAFKSVKAKGGDADGFLSYLLSMRAVQKARGYDPTDPNRQPTGKVVDTGFNTLAALEKISRPEEQAKYEEGRQIWQGMTNGFLDYMGGKGFYSPEQVEAMKQSNSAAYVSFRAAMGDPGGRLAQPKGRFNVYDPLRKMVGSDGQVRDPIMATLDNMRLGIQMADRNAARLFMVDKAIANPEIAAQIGLRKVGPLDVNEDQVIELMRKYGLPEGQPGPNGGPGYTPEQIDAWRTLMEERLAKLDDNTMVVRRDGQSEVWKIDDPAYAKMLQFADTPQEVNLIASMATTFARLARTGIVTMPDFALRMTGWHQLNQFIMDPHSPPPFVTWARGAVEAFGGGKLYQDALAKGAIVDNYADLEKDTVARDIDRIYEPTGLKQRLMNGVGSFVHAAEWFNQRLSAANRIGLYQHYQSKGIDPVKAAMLSRKAGIDYSERATSQLLNQFARYAPFLRPKFLGMKQGFEALGDHPVQTLAKAALIVSAPVLIFRALNWMADQGKQDDDPTRLDAVPRYIRYSHYVTPPIAGTRLYIRQPANFGMPFGGLVDRTLDAMQKHDPHAFDGFMQDILKEYVPPLSASPAMVTPALEVMSNHDFNTGRTLASDTMLKMSGPSQFTDNTSEPAKKLSQVINPAWSNLTGQQASPVALEHLIQGWGGPTASAAMQALNAPMGHLGPPQDLADMPFFKSFIVRNPRFNASQIEDFYTDKSDFDRAHADLSAALGRMSTGQSQPEDVAKLMGNPAAGAAQAGDSISKALTNMRMVAKAIEADKDMSPVEKSQHLDTIYSEAIQFAKLGSTNMRAIQKAGQQ